MTYLIILGLLYWILTLKTELKIRQYKIESLERKLEASEKLAEYYKSFITVIKKDRDIFMKKYYHFKNSFLNPN